MKHWISITLALLVLSIAASPNSRAATRSRSKPEETVWTWEVRPAHTDASLPNVLLEGDSLTRNAFPEVQRQLAGKANVYLMASSICVGNPRLPKEIVMFAKMENVRFRVVHFNNGMHGWEYSEAEYRAGFPAYLAALHSIAPKATFIWATTTAVKVEMQPGPTNARIDARNAIAQQFVRDMMVDDQHALMEKHRDLYADNIHFNAKGSNISGAQAADEILHALEKPARQKR